MTFPKKSDFLLPDGVIYLNGNSLGPLPSAAQGRAATVIGEEWGGQLIRAWNTRGWMALPTKVGDRIAGLIGAAHGTVTTGDTLSIKVFQALAAAIRLNPDRRIILSDKGNFPTDLYMADGLNKLIGSSHTLSVVEPEQVFDAITDEVAVVMLTEVDYRTGRLHDMATITKRAHEKGAIVIWDLAHSAGALPIDLTACRADFAVGCTYKYLNGGPGAPAFIYVRPDLIDHIQPALAGWLGHDAPFAMELGYRPAMSIERMRVGTPSIVQLSILDTALDIWDGVDLHALRRASIALSESYIEQVEAACPQLRLASPRDPMKRGSQVSFAFDQAYAVMQALIARGVIGDFRSPDIMRFGFTPLFIDQRDVDAAAAHLADVMAHEEWRDPAFQTRSRVT